VKKIKSVNIWQSYKQERGCLMHFAHLTNTLLKDEESEYFLNRFRFDRIVAMSLWPTFFGPPFIC